MCETHGTFEQRSHKLANYIISSFNISYWSLIRKMMISCPQLVSELLRAKIEDNKELIEIFDRIPGVPEAVKYREALDDEANQALFLWEELVGCYGLEELPSLVRGYTDLENLHL